MKRAMNDPVPLSIPGLHDRTTRMLLPICQPPGDDRTPVDLGAPALQDADEDQPADG